METESLPVGQSSLIGTWKNDLNSTTETNSVSNKGMSSGGVYETAVSASDNPIRPSLLQIIQRQDPGPVFGFTIIFNLSASFRPLSGEQEGNGAAEDNLATAEGGGIRGRRLGGAQRWSQHLLPQQVRGNEEARDDQPCHASYSSSVKLWGKEASLGRAAEAALRRSRGSSETHKNTILAFWQSQKFQLTVKPKVGWSPSCWMPYSGDGPMGLSEAETAVL
ncbi:avidin-related protein 1-like [Crotalus adamanteus]|uniref:Avidin-related protein 1-like n=1 Tax=Crotalus adamanteus TaxID=8729 RepID=A0AAW1C2N5_CROAD